jgi:glutathione S-transferase
MLSGPRIVRLYDSTIPSGNAYKVHLALAHLEQSVDVIDLNILAQPSETRSEAFLDKNPNGRIPLAELSDGSFLPESNAILLYLLESTRFVPSDPVERARMLGWLFFEQYSHERFIAVLKFWTYWGGLEKKRPEEVSEWRTQGQAALNVMETHLRARPFFSGPEYGAADIALFAYTQSAADIGLDVSALAELPRWLDRVRSQPGYVPMKPDPLGCAPACT